MRWLADYKAKLRTAEEAVDFIKSSRIPTGAWSYVGKSTSDTSVTGWMFYWWAFVA